MNWLIVKRVKRVADWFFVVAAVVVTLSYPLEWYLRHR